jgi:hypothetical protein
LELAGLRPGRRWNVEILEDQLARLDPADHPRRAALLGTLGVELFYGERRAEGERFAEEAVELARRYGDLDLRARTLNNYCIATWIPERAEARLSAVNEMLALGPLPRRVELVGRLHRLTVLMSKGQLAAYDADLARCRQLAGEIRMPELAAQVTYAAGGRAILGGRWAEGERLVEEAFVEQQRTSMWGAQWIRLTLLYTSRRFQSRSRELLDELVSSRERAWYCVHAVLAACEAGDGRSLGRCWTVRCDITRRSGTSPSGEPPRRGSARRPQRSTARSHSPQIRLRRIEVLLRFESLVILALAGARPTTTPSPTRGPRWRRRRRASDACGRADQRRVRGLIGRAAPTRGSGIWRATSCQVSAR